MKKQSQDNYKQQEIVDILKIEDFYTNSNSVEQPDADYLETIK